MLKYDKHELNSDMRSENDPELGEFVSIETQLFCRLYKYLMGSAASVFLLFVLSLSIHAGPEHVVRAYISSSPPQSLHPNDAGTELITNYINQLFDTLTFLDANGNLKPSLAVSWESIDKQSYLFQLRKGVKFHNGEDFNADAVVYTINLFLDPKERVDNKYYWGPISGVQKVDDYSVLIMLSKPDSLLPYRLATVGQILPPKYYSKVRRKKFCEAPIGTGPFIFEGHAANGKLVYRANSQYWDGKPQIDKIEFHFISSIDDAVNDLINGKLDFVSMVPGHYAKRLMQTGTVTPSKAIINNSAIVMLNTKKEGILKNPEVRQALRTGLNMDDIVKYGYNGNGRVTSALTYDGQLFHPDDLKKYTFDFEGARRLLKNAEIKDGTKLNILVIKPFDLVGGIIGKQLQRMGFNPIIHVGTAEDEKEAVLHPNKKGVAPNVDILVTTCGDRFANGAFPMIILMHSAGTWSVTNDKELDLLLDKAMTSTTSSEQIQYFRLASKFISDNNLILPGFQIGIVYGIRKPLKYTPHITGYIYFKNVSI